MTGGPTIILDHGDCARSAFVMGKNISPRTHPCDVHLSISEGARNGCPVIRDHKIIGSAHRAARFRKNGANALRVSVADG